MPSRVLRDWTDSLPLDGITADAERLFVRLIMKADDYGRFHAEPRLVRAGCFPLSDNLRTNDLSRWLDELSTRQLILRYETQGRTLLAIVNFNQRLRIARPKFPAPDGEPKDWLANVSESPPLADNPPPLAADGGDPPPDSDLDSDLDLDKETPTASVGQVIAARAPILPTLAQAMEFAPACGIEPKAAECWWLDCEGRGLSPTGHFIDAKGNEIRHWKSAITSYGRKWQSNDARRAAPARAASRAPAAAPVHKKEDDGLL